MVTASFGSLTVAVLVLVMLPRNGAVPSLSTMVQNRLNRAAAQEELDIFSRCIWPINLEDVRPRFAAAEGGFLLGDDVLGLAAILFLAFGAVVMYWDLGELRREAEAETEKVASKLQARADDFSPPSLPTFFAFLAFGLAAAVKAVSTPIAAAECLRVPVLAAREMALTAIDGQALEELLLLPGFGHPRHRTPLLCDAIAAVSLLGFGVLGVAAMCADMREMAKEDDRAVPASSADSSQGSSSCNRKGNKRSVNRPRRLVLMLVVSIMVLLASLPANEMRKEPPIDELAAHWAAAASASASGSGWPGKPMLCGPAPPDAVVAMIVVALITAGWFVTLTDLFELQAEDESGTSAKKRSQEKKRSEKLSINPHSAGLEDVVKVAKKHASALDYFVSSWRLISCVVLLLSICGAGVASFLDNEM